MSAEGEYEVIKDGKVLGRCTIIFIISIIMIITIIFPTCGHDYPSKRLGVGKAFGELAILYNCKRTASIKVSGWL